METHSLIDWMAFTVPIRHELSSNSYNIQGGASRALSEYLGVLWEKLVLFSGEGEWERRNGRSPYSDSFFNGYGLSVFVGIRSQNVLVEITGKGCDWVRECGIESALLNKCSKRFSRIDIATDLLCNDSPSSFVDAGYSAKFKTSARVSSVTGETCYIGSKKSERYCRVYRYAEPHERSKLLRVEYVFRKGAAKKLAEQLCKESVRRVASGAAAIYQWEHDHMQGHQEKMDLKAYRPDRKSGKTLVWLIGQVAPAFRRLVEAGVIEEPEEFLHEHFLSNEDQDDGV